MKINSKQLITRLQKLDIKTNIEELRRWSKKELIPEYKTHYQPKRKKRGRPQNPEKARKKGIVEQKARVGPVSEWPEESVLWAAAVWAVRYCGGIKSRALTKEMIDVIRRSAKSIYSSAPVECTIPPITRWLGGEQPLPFPEQFHLQFAPNYPADDKRILLFPGETHEERIEKLNELIKLWIATIEKARDPDWIRNIGRNGDVSPITQRAKVHIYLTASRRTWKDSNGNPVLELDSTYDHTKLEKLENSDVDQIYLYENGIDIRVRILRTLAAQTQLIFGSSPH